MESLLSRFLLNLPASELADPFRLIYHAEQAYWFYIDYLGVEQKRMTQEMFTHLFLGKVLPSPLLKTLPTIKQYERLYKWRIPTAGCIIFTDEKEDKKVLMVQTRASSKNRYSFPKGKQNRGEPLLDTALRETREETGLLFSPKNIFRHLKCDDVHFFILHVPSSFSASPPFPKNNENKEIRWAGWLSIKNVDVRTLSVLARKIWSIIVSKEGA